MHVKTNHGSKGKSMFTVRKRKMLKVQLALASFLILRYVVVSLLNKLKTNKTICFYWLLVKEQ